MSLIRGASQTDTIEIGKPHRLADAVLTVVSRSLAFVAIVVYLPILLVVGLLVARTSHGPVVVQKAYRRVRCGGLVYLYEFRTECWRTWTQTGLGKFLTMADLHRLPRMINVLTGEVHIGETLERVGV